MAQLTPQNDRLAKQNTSCTHPPQPTLGCPLHTLLCSWNTFLCCHCCLEAFQVDQPLCNLHSIKTRETRVDVGMVQCASEGHGKPTGGKPIKTRRRAGPCKEGGQPVHAKPRSLTFTDFEYICTIPTSGNILLHLWSCYHPLFLHLHIVMQL